jgi:hypothetical protein
MPANAGHALDCADDDLDNTIQNFIAQDELQWHAENAYELMPDITQNASLPAARSTALVRRGLKRVRFQDQLATVKDAELQSKLACMVSTRSGKRASSMKNQVPANPASDHLPPMATQHNVTVQDDAEIHISADDIEASQIDSHGMIK